MRSLSAEDGRLVVEDFNRTENAALLGRCIPELLEQTVASHTDKTALICGDTTMSFGQLNAGANGLARVLSRRGLGRGSLVGVALERSVNLVMVLVAVLKSGASYLVVDPMLPPERMRQMLDDAAPDLVVAVADGRVLGMETSLELDGTTVEEMWDAMDAQDDNNINPETGVVAQDIAYVIYTSGSTGQPKGVEVSHGALCNFVLAMHRDRGCTEDGRLLATATVSFDMAGYELFTPLLHGATTVMAQTHEQRDARALLRLIKQHAITMMIATPTTWQMLLDAGWGLEPRLQAIMCGGENLSQRLADRLLDRSDAVWNQYGPAETTVCASAWRVRRGEDVIIGNPIDNARLYVLDESLSPVPVGRCGELYIGGAGVARGYRNNLQLTQSRFLANPFHDGRIYRTGDLARFLTPQKISLVGRADGQVKVRGHRVEVGDIEAAILAHDHVSAAAVVILQGRLVAYCVRDRAAGTLEAGAAAETGLDVALRSWLGERLPDYMIPAFFVELRALPVGHNGKVDRRSLPDPIQAAEARSGPGPRSELERGIAAVWASVLGHERVGLDDNFFHIGGDSARVVRMQTELESALGRSVPSHELYEHHTVRSLALHLAGGEGPRQDSAHVRGRAAVPGRDDIAVVSMACRLPGGIDTPEAFWDLLHDGGDVVTEVPKDRWDAESLYDANPDAAGKSYCRRGGFIGPVDPASFDAPFFGISPREGRGLDPTQHLMLETCWEAFERAGYTAEQLRRSPTGVFAGISSVPIYQGCGDAGGRLQDLDGHAGTGSAGSTVSGCISYTLGLEGPSMTVDTACSSSLVATHLACTALRQGECNMAVVGGVSLLLTPGLHVEFSRLRGISADGRCRSFAANTQGTGWGEGCAVVVLKRAADALRDGDDIHAVLRGTAVNHGGAGAGLTVPSGPAQRRLIRAALARSALEPADLDYVEAHGTGTALGDPIEGAALADVFRGSHSAEAPLWVGSAKSNLGHTQAAAGLVGLLKVALSMRHGVLPQTLHAREPTKAVDWVAAGMALVQESQPWPFRAGRPRRAGVSAFGISGTNAHVVVEEPPARPVRPSAVAECVPLPPTVPVVLSGHTDAALREQAAKLRLHLLGHSPGASGSFGDIAYSLATSRNHFRHRLVLMASDKDDLVRKLAEVPGRAPTVGHGEKPRLVMLFPGQGSQRTGMGRHLSRYFPVFRGALHQVAHHFAGELDRPLLDVMWSEPGSEAAGLLRRTDYAQPALFALSVALWRLWNSWGVRPDMVLGHSAGELAAAYAAGLMDLADACRFVAARGRLMQAITGDGAMASLEASAYDVEEAIGALGLSSKVVVAGRNTPTQTVVSGDADAVEHLTKHFAARGCLTKKLDVSHAFHSHHVDSAKVPAALREVAETICFRAPTIAMVSTLTGKLVDPAQQPSYWAEQARCCVMFSDGMEALSDLGADLFLELGPKPVLCALGAACMGANVQRPCDWLPSLVPGRNEVQVAHESLTALHVRNAAVDWHAYFHLAGCRRVDLPTYAFQRRLIAATESKHQDDQTHLEFELVWQTVSASEGVVRVSGTWGLLCPAGEVPWARELADALSRSGVRLEQVEQLGDAEGLDGLLCLWSSGAGVIDQTCSLAETALLQLQAAVQRRFVPPLVWITRDAVGAGDAEPGGPAGLGAAPLWGMMRTARSEQPELRLRLVDLGSDSLRDPDALAAALFMPVAEPECAVRPGVLVPRMLPVDGSPQPPGPPQPLVRPGGAVLITGGLGYLGARLAHYLASTHGVRDLVLTSRRGIEAPGAHELVQQLARLGATATVVAGDVADAEFTRSLIAMFDHDRPPLRAVVHAAGVSDTGVLSTLEPHRCAPAFAPKVDGAWHLHQLTRSMELDMFVMFSSISGVLGMPGLAIYAAANTFLDSRPSTSIPGAAGHLAGIWPLSG